MSRFGRVSSENLVVLYVRSFLTATLLFLGMKFSLPRFYPGDRFLYGFLFQYWPVQFLSTWLFVLGLVYGIGRFVTFSREEEVYKKVKLPKGPIDRGRVENLLQKMPQEHEKTLTLRRYRELLQAFGHGEDVIRLNEELSRRDVAQIEQGHSVLNTVRSLIPVLGFLGTVIGLSLGMIAFPDIQNMELMRKALKDFAASLSVAFNTTLLALLYTIIVILMTSFLREREERLVRRIDEQARTLIGELKIGGSVGSSGPGGDLLRMGEALNQTLLQWKAETLSFLNDFMSKLSAQGSSSDGTIVNAVVDLSRMLSSKLDSLKQGLQQPPHYRIVVQPLQNRGGEDEK